MSGKITRVTGDNSPINFQVSFDKIGPIDLSANTTKITIEKNDGTAVVTAATTGLTVQPTQNFTADATTDRLTRYEHGVRNGDQLLLTTSAADLPAGLSTGVRYFAIQVTEVSFQVSLSPDGAPVDITDAGTGTHSFAIVGSGSYLPQSAYAVGIYRVWIEWVGSTTYIVPESRYGFELEVLEKGN